MSDALKPGEILETTVAELATITIKYLPPAERLFYLDAYQVDCDHQGWLVTRSELEVFANDLNTMLAEQRGRDTR